MSSGILNSLDEAVVLLARTQNVTKMRKFCVVLTNMNAVLLSGINLIQNKRKKQFDSTRNLFRLVSSLFFKYFLFLFLVYTIKFIEFTE